MIIRGSIECDVCGRSHTLRIGVGSEEVHSHKFSCRGCGEDLVVRLIANFVKASAHIECSQNCKRSAEVAGADIVNLDPVFLIPDTEQGKDRIFPRLSQSFAVVKKAEARGPLKTYSADELMKSSRPFRRQDFSGEWTRLSIAWSLAVKGKVEISLKKIGEASSIYYAEEPLNDLADWLWRFSLFFSYPYLEAEFSAMMHHINTLMTDERFQRLMEVYNKHFTQRRISMYRDIYKQFFDGYDEYSQVILSVKNDLTSEQALYKASSNNFDKVKMFYGNAFEVYANLVEILALMNNVSAARDFDRFEKLTLAQYRSLDKANKTGPFRSNVAFYDLCREMDNSLRNASHHSDLKPDKDPNYLIFTSGKGGAGRIERISYVDYLVKCVKIFLQIVNLMKMELIMHLKYNNTFPQN